MNEKGTFNNYHFSLSTGDLFNPGRKVRSHSEERL